MIVAEQIKLADARAELGFSQKALAALAGVSKPVVTNAEKGLAIQRIQAHRILARLNVERQKVGKQALSISDLDWKIYSR